MKSNTMLSILAHSSSPLPMLQTKILKHISYGLFACSYFPFKKKVAKLLWEFRGWERRCLKNYGHFLGFEQFAKLCILERSAGRGKGFLNLRGKGVFKAPQMIYKCYICLHP